MNSRQYNWPPSCHLYHGPTTLKCLCVSPPRNFYAFKRNCQQDTHKTEREQEVSNLVQVNLSIEITHRFLNISCVCASKSAPFVFVCLHLSERAIRWHLNSGSWAWCCQCLRHPRGCVSPVAQRRRAFSESMRVSRCSSSSNEDSDHME